MKHKGIYLLIPLTITIALSSLIYTYQKRQNIILQQKSVIESQSKVPKVISGEIGNVLQETRPPTAIAYMLNVTKINLIINKNFNNTRDEQFMHMANNIQGFGWIDEKSKSLGFKISFHNSAFSLKDEKQIDEIKNTLLNGDINIKFLVQDQEDFFLKNDAVQKNLPVMITVNNNTRGEVAKIIVLSNQDDIKINGVMELNMSDYGITPPSKDKVYEYDDKIKIDFEAEARPLK